MFKTTSTLYDETKSIHPKLSPLEYYLLNTLHLESKDVNEDVLIESAKIKFGVDVEKVKRALDNSLIVHHGYIIKKVYVNKENSSDTKSFLSISETAWHSLYAREYENPMNKYSWCHTAIAALADHNISQYHYCMVNLNEKNLLADLIIHSFKSKTGEENLYLNDIVHPDDWSSEVIAVKVETNPMIHKDQIYLDFINNSSYGMGVYFAVFNKKHKELILDIMMANNVDSESYDIILLNSETLDRYKKCDISQSELRDRC